MNISYSVNPRCIDKPEKRWIGTKGWELKSGVPVSEMVRDITHDGFAVNWCEFTGGYRDGDNVLSTWGIGIDIDNETGGVLTLEEAKQHPIYSTATVAYPSPSYGIKGERFRLLWAVPEGIEHAEVRRIQVQLMDYTPGIDKSCKSPHNIWYGNSTGEPFWVNEDVPFPFELHQEIWQAWYDEHGRPKAATVNVLGNNRGRYDRLIHGAVRDYEAEAIRLLKKIPPRGPSGSGTYHGARDALIVLLQKFGPDHTRELCRVANWYGEWDQDKQIDDLWSWLNSCGDTDCPLTWGSLIYLAQQS
jgi:hypothetical protein